MAPFEIETGSPIRCSSGTWSEWFGEAMAGLADEMPALVAITAAMPDGTGLVPMRERHPSRVLDVGIAEQHAVTLAAGLAVGGVKPVVALYSTFLQRAYDQALHDVCLQSLPVVFAVDRAGVVGDDGETHQGIYDLSYLQSMPGLTILAPASGKEMLPMLRYALTAAEGPVAIRYPRGCADLLPDAETPILPGKSVLLRDGSNGALFAVGALVPAALEAANKLAAEGVSCAVIHVRFVKPFDHQLLAEYARRTHFVMTLEDNVLPGGFGATVAQFLANEDIPCHVLNLGYPDMPILQDTRAGLLTRFELDAPGIVRQVRQFIHKGGAYGQKEA